MCSILPRSFAPSDFGMMPAGARGLERLSIRPGKGALSLRVTTYFDVGVMLVIGLMI